jgi:hypothetical protein
MRYRRAKADSSQGADAAKPDGTACQFRISRPSLSCHSSRHNSQTGAGGTGVFGLMALDVCALDKQVRPPMIIVSWDIEWDRSKAG